MAYPHLALRPNRNVLVSHYVVAGSKNPLPLGMGSVKDNQHTALAIVASMRHTLHCTKDTNERNVRDKSINFFERLMPIMLRVVGLPTMVIDADALDKSVKSGVIEDIREAIESVNAEVENYLRAVDRVYGTTYCPTGIQRQKRANWLASVC